MLGLVTWIALVGLILPAFGRSGFSGNSSSAEAAETRLAFGALLAESAGWTSLGEASAAALDVATEDINAYLADSGWPYEVSVDVRDTGGDPEMALAELQDLADEGVRIVIGPQSSSEVAAVKPLADAANVILMSQGSTAGSLSLGGDNVFRLPLDDSHEADALTALLAADGIQVVIPVWRADAGNAGLVDALRPRFNALGGSVAAGLSYAPTTTDFSAMIASLRRQVEQARTETGAADVGVYLAAFDEVAILFEQIADDPVLASVRWYGSDGAALNDALIADPRAAQFAARVSYPTPIFGLDPVASPLRERVAAQITARIGHQPDAFALSAYDALWLATLATLGQGKSRSDGALQASLRRVANSYEGVTGSTALNGADDRLTGNFDFWAVRPQAGGGFAWRLVARYESAAAGPGGEIVRLEE